MQTDTVDRLSADTPPMEQDAIPVQGSMAELERDGHVEHYATV